jgi:hypothetical protein
MLLRSLNPRFLAAGSEWPQIPFGVFFVMGSDFQGNCSF